MNRRELLKSAAIVGAAAVVGVSTNRHGIRRITARDEYEEIRYLRVSLRHGDEEFHHRLVIREEDWAELTGTEREQIWKTAEDAVIRHAEAA